jgi:hypothetical protein
MDAKRWLFERLSVLMNMVGSIHFMLLILEGQSLLPVSNGFDRFNPL